MPAIDTVVTPLGAGALAGLGVAMPLGAIGVLVVQEGITGGWRPAAAAGTGVAVVDGLYATVAVAAGAAVTGALTGRERWVQLAGAVVLVAVVVRGLLGSGPRGADAVRDAPGGAGRPGAAQVRRADRREPDDGGLLRRAHRRAWGTWSRARRRPRRSPSARSWPRGRWQLSLAGAAALAGPRLPPWLRLATSLAGYLLVAGYAVRLALG